MAKLEKRSRVAKFSSLQTENIFSTYFGSAITKVKWNVQCQSVSQSVSIDFVPWGSWFSMLSWCHFYSTFGKSGLSERERFHQYMNSYVKLWCIWATTKAAISSLRPFEQIGRGCDVYAILLFTTVAISFVLYLSMQ